MLNRVTALLIGMAISAPAFAQAPKAPAQHGPAAAPSVPRAAFIANMDAEFAQMDANHDGRLTKAEIESFQRTTAAAAIQARNRAVFAALDTDHNGVLSQAEFARFTATPPAPNAMPVLQRFDANKDGVVTQIEYRAGTLVNFDQLDTDKDGVVTEAEMRAGGLIKK